MSNLESVSVQTARFGRLTGVTAGRGDKTLLMLHGIGGNAGGWSAELAAFSPHFRVVAWNAPGYLDSTPLDADAPALADYADAAVALLDGLGATAPVCLLGHSFGGLVASMIAALHPQRVRRLILADCSSGHRLYPPEDRERLLKARLAFDPNDAGAYARSRVPNLLCSKPAPEHVERAVAVLSQLRQPGFGQATRMIADADLFEHASRIVAPTRVLCGTEDKVTSEALNRRIAAAIAGAHYVPIEGAGHWSFLEQPAAFHRAVLEFFNPAE